MAHGDIVTSAIVKGLDDSSHWLGEWANRGFGKDVVAAIIAAGDWTHYVVDSTSDTGGDGTAGKRTLRHALGLGNTSKRWITFSPSLGSFTITLATDMPVFNNKFVDGRYVKCTIGGTRSIEAATSTPGLMGWVNIIFACGSVGNEVVGLSGIDGSGRQKSLFLKNWFSAADGDVDDPWDITDPATQGIFASMFFNRIGTSNGDRMERGPTWGNNRQDQTTKHARITMGRNAFYNTGGSYVRQRMPIFNDGHLESYENYRAWGLAGLQVRNSNQTAGGVPVTVVQDAICRSRWDMWDIRHAETAANEDDGITITSNAWVRVENAIKANNGVAASFDLAENSRASVTNAAIYEDSANGGASLSTYNDYTPGTELTGLTIPQAEAFLKNGASWCEGITLGGTLHDTDEDNFDGKTITVTTSVSNWPSLSNTQKETLLDGFTSTGDAWADIRDLLDSGDVSVSGKTVTITIPSGVSAAVDLTEDEDLSLTIPSSLLTGSSDSGADNTLHLVHTTGSAVTATPSVASLTLTTFAPTVTATQEQIVTPSPLSLVTTMFAPTVTVSGNQEFTPSPASLTTTTFAPTVTASDHKIATPSPASLSLTTFTPDVLVQATAEIVRVASVITTHPASLRGDNRYRRRRR